MSSGKKDFAYKVIKNKILEGVLPPLSDISEDDLVSELEVSRTPVREAIQRLQKEGFVYIYPRKGTIVTEVTRDLIYEIYQMRRLNEPFIAKQSCGMIPEEWLMLKRSAFENPPKELDTQGLRSYYIGLDRELHISLLDFCGNRFLQNIMRVVYDHNHRIRNKVSNPQSEERDKSIIEHISIIDMLLAKDSDGVEKVVAEHVENSEQILLGYIKK
ncbi:GntR family transcriptional regulator [Petroclostridium sp. X23]|uniref:GntR family transcriptional regulator n=1 Tax=Petroclostridium sp. X23 TaxID=3045146 RepID=UPI0024AE84E5|nr:GntR family transcriptional regulator [Petroclostridium sp. X23]WHH60202.1 GntR family transcriptional regulator [Petroclostridium sp. X23]